MPIPIKNILKIIFFLLLLFFINNNLFAQNEELDKYLNLANKYLEINSDSAKIFAEKVISIATNNGQEKYICYGKIVLGCFYLFKKNDLEAFKNYLEAEKIIPKNLSTEYHLALYSNLGIIYNNQAETDLALEKYKIAYNYAEKLKKESDIISSLTNIANIYYRLEDYEKALKFYFEILENIKKNNIEYDKLPILYLNIGYNYSLQNKPQNCEKYYKYAYNLSDSLKYKIFKARAAISLTNFYIKEKIYSKAEFYFNIADSILKIDSIIDYYENFYSAGYNLFSATKNFEKALEFLEKYYSFTDALYSEELDNTVNELKTKYEVEKIKSESENKDKQIKEQKKYNKLLIIILIIIILFAIIAIIFTIFLKQTIKQKNKLNYLLQETNNEINNNLIYAREIHNAIMKNNCLQNKFDFFVIDKPKHKVGGDFYLMKQKYEKIFVVLGDCTGHGISGAILSTLGFQYVVKAIEQNTNPQEILNSINQDFYENISKSESLCHESLCITIVCIEKNKISFIGSKHRIWLYKSEERKIFEYRTSNQEIGVEQNFYTEAQEIQIVKEDVLFLSSDGYADQFGKIGKLKYNRFRDYLAEVSEIPVNQAKIELENRFNLWKNELEQTDDVLIIGIKNLKL